MTIANWLVATIGVQKSKRRSIGPISFCCWSHFIGSEYIHRIELPAALRRRQEHGSVVVPVLVQDCARMLLAIDDINYLPKDPSGALKPLDKWRGAERNSGCRQVTEHVLAQIERRRRRNEPDVNAATSLGRPKPERSASAIPARALVQNASGSTAAEPNREQDNARIPHKPEPPTRVVDALYRGDHATIVEALHSARRRDRILVRPGMYRENIIIDKPVEIVGDGKIDDVIIETT